MKLDADWVTAAPTRRIMELLAEAGHGAWFVGGCVRDALLQVSVSDIDIATDARPDCVVGLAEAAGLRAVPTGIDHGTVTLIADHHPFEITTLRRDVATDGRRATVAFTDRLEEDAARRDFTMNALYATSEGVIVDPLGTGLADLAARRVRFIGDANARLREDYLRSLRFFRFHAWYGDPAQGLDAEGLAACAAALDGLSGLARERIGAEMKKLLAAPDPAQAVAAMAQTGVLGRCLPGATAHVLPILIHLEDVPPDPIRRLAALGGAEVADRLRLSRAERTRLETLDRDSLAATPAAELGYRLGAETAWDALLLRAARLEEPLPDGAKAAVAQGAAARFPLVAADLMPRFQGADLGRKLAALEARWIASGFTMSKDELLENP